MVKGLDIFKKYFEQYPDNYVIFGNSLKTVITETKKKAMMNGSIIDSKNQRT